MFLSSKHNEALARLRYVVEQKKIGAILLGEHGSGKTYLSKVLKKISDQKTRRFVYIINPRVSIEDFLKEVCVSLGCFAMELESKPKGVLIAQLKKRLEELYSQGVHVVVVIDEAQNIEQVSFLEEIRMLLNVQGEEENYFSLIFIGQPMFKKLIDQIPQFVQRIAVFYVLENLNEHETKAYIEHRIFVAGGKEEIFLQESIADIYRISKGSPRSINNICDLALLLSFSQNLNYVDKNIILKVETEANVLEKS